MPMIEGGFSLESGQNGNIISVQTQSALRIFNNLTVKYVDQYARLLGLYGEVVLGNDKEARFMSFTTPRHILSSRKSGCSWHPKGKVRANTDIFPTCPVEYDGEECPDAFYGTCFERLFGPGNDVKDFYATPEAQQLLARLIEKVYLGLGNSFFDLYNFANHPLISEINTNSTYTVGTEEWEDYLDQMTSGDCGGLITLMDQLASEGMANLSLDIPETDLNIATGEYTGNIIDLIESLKAAAPAELKQAIASGMLVNGQVRRPVVLLAYNEFEAYKAYIRSIAGTNELAYRYMIERQDGMTPMSSNVLMYDQMPVILWEAVSNFDAITGAQSHRAAIVAPGNFGVISDINSITNQQFNGQGLVMQQSPLLKDKGKIFMTTTYRWGAGIADPKFLVMASNVLIP